MLRPGRWRHDVAAERHRIAAGHATTGHATGHATTGHPSHLLIPRRRIGGGVVALSDCGREGDGSHRDPRTEVALLARWEQAPIRRRQPVAAQRCGLLKRRERLHVGGEGRLAEARLDLVEATPRPEGGVVGDWSTRRLARGRRSPRLVLRQSAATHGRRTDQESVPRAQVLPLGRVRLEPGELAALEGEAPLHRGDARTPTAAPLRPPNRRRHQAVGSCGILRRRGYIA